LSFALHLIGGSLNIRELCLLLQLKPLICVPAVGKDLNSVSKAVDKAIKSGADMVEFRIDTLQNPDPDGIRRLVENMEHKIIATNRMQNEGGFFQGSEKERTDILMEIAEIVYLVDIELQTPDKYRSKVIEASRSNIVSFHDFEKTPPVEELLRVVAEQRKLGDMAKFAVMPQNIQDTLRVLEVLSQVQNTIGISMGNLGRYTRVIAPLFGSPITFASLDAESAPGQLDIRTTRSFLNQLFKLGD